MLCSNYTVLTSQYFHGLPDFCYTANKFFYFQFQIRAKKMQRFLIYLFLQMLYMFQAVPLPIIRST